MSYFPDFDRTTLSGAYNNVNSALTIVDAAITNVTTLAGAKPSINVNNFYDPVTAKREEEYVYFTSALFKLNAVKAELLAAKTALEEI